MLLASGGFWQLALKGALSGGEGPLTATLVVIKRHNARLSTCTYNYGDGLPSTKGRRCSVAQSVFRRFHHPQLADVACLRTGQNRLQRGTRGGTLEAMPDANGFHGRRRGLEESRAYNLPVRFAATL